MTGSGKRGRRQTATTAEKEFRKILRDYGYRCEAIPLIRQHDDAHTAIITPVDEIGNIAEVFTAKRDWGQATLTEITRIHIPKPNKYGQPWCRVYFRWVTPSGS